MTPPSETPCAPAETTDSELSFQMRVQPWLLACFGPEIASDKIERNHRFLEEALETVQSAGCTRSEAHQLVDYVFGRPAGDLSQEVGGVMNTLAALCPAHGLDMHACGKIELSRVWTKLETIRAKQAAKPKHSPLPEHTVVVTELAAAQERIEKWKMEAVSLSRINKKLCNTQDALRAQIVALEASAADMRAHVERLINGASGNGSRITVSMADYYSLVDALSPSRVASAVAKEKTP